MHSVNNGRGDTEQDNPAVLSKREEHERPEAFIPRNHDAALIPSVEEHI